MERQIIIGVGELKHIETNLQEVKKENEVLKKNFRDINNGDGFFVIVKTYSRVNYGTDTTYRFISRDEKLVELEAAMELEFQQKAVQTSSENYQHLKRQFENSHALELKTINDKIAKYKAYTDKPWYYRMFFEYK